MKAILFALCVISQAGHAATDDPAEACKGTKDKLAENCKSDGAKADAVLEQCTNFFGTVKETDGQVAKLKTDCAKAAVTGSKKTAKKSKGDQNLAYGGAADLAAENQDFMKKCAEGMGQLRDQYKTLSDTAAKNAQDAAGYSEKCLPVVKKTFSSLKKVADDRVSQAQGLQDQYTKGGKAADKMAEANVKNGAGMNTAGQGDAKKEQAAGGGGGGMPKLPEIPPQKKDQSKSPQQMLAEAQKARQQQCQGLINAYSTGVLTCDGQHHCQPEVARVVDVCNAYNACIKALPAVPSDCQGAPAPAQPK